MITKSGSDPRTRRLILVRHSLSEIRPEVPVARWRLSAEGVARAGAFAERVDPGSAERIFSSAEPKALETARILASRWKVPVDAVDGLHEHLRPEARMLPPAQFRERVREVFMRPSAVVFGAESASAALDRFSAAVTNLVERTETDLVIVSHGTVMALFVGAVARIDPWSFWSEQTMPCAATLSLPEFSLVGMLTWPASA